MSRIKERMNVINEFVDKVRSTDSSFSIRDGENTVCFVQEHVGDARYVYGERGFADDYDSRFKKELEVVAVVHDNIVCIVNLYCFSIYSLDSIELPERCELMSECVKRFIDGFKGRDLIRWYNAIECEPDGPDYDRTLEARDVVLFKGGQLPPLPTYSIFGAQEVAQVLAGRKTIAQIEDDYFKKHFNSYKSEKARRLAIQNLIREGCVSEWEIEIANAMREIEAKAVTVEFEYNGKIDKGKMRLDSLRRALLHRSRIDYPYFLNQKEGRELMRIFGIDEFGIRDVLTCANITKITYGRKVLYERSEAK